ncbi:MAG: HAMP domain-containing sensor histidine kinase [Clostridia bacterium]
MHKSLFKKYLGITMTIVLCSYIGLGSIMLVFFSDYWKNEKKNLLTTNATAIAEFASEFTQYTEGQGYTLNASTLSVFIEMLARNIDADIFVADLEGNRILGSYLKSDLDTESFALIPADKIEMAASGLYEEMGNFDGAYKQDYYTIGVPISITDENGDEIIAGVVFASTSVSSVRIYTYATLQMFLLAAIVTLGITFIAVWGFTYKMVKPLRQMSNAAKVFGSGDFSARVSIPSHDEIGELAVAFNNMANSLSNSEGIHRSFIANVSHELKTPMTTISGFIDGILDGTIPADRQSYYLNIISQETKRLSRLVKSMLDLSRIDSGELKLTPVKFNLTDKVFTTLISFENRIEEKNIEIRGLDEIASFNVTGDQDLLHQVIYNLIENSVKFTNEGGFISFCIYDTFDRVGFSIENSGVGINSDELPMIFDKFYKTDKSRSQDKNGMGLGLYLVQTIIRFHGGDITVSSSPNLTTKFEFYLPNIKDKSQNMTDGSVINLSASAEVDVQDVDVED